MDNMAFIAGNNGSSGSPPGSSSVASTSTQQDQQPQINFSQLMALMQQQQQQQAQAQQQQHSAAAAAVAAPSPLMQASTIPQQQSAFTANQAVLYQQLLLQNQLQQQAAAAAQQQQQQQQQQAVQQQQQAQPQTSGAYLQHLQQLAAHLQQPQSANATAAPTSIPQVSMNPLLQQQQPQSISAGQSSSNSAVTTALLLAIQQQQQAQQQAQQQQQQQMNPTVAMLTNMLSQFPQSTLQQVAPLISLLANQGSTPSTPPQDPRVSGPLIYPTPLAPQQQPVQLSQPQQPQPPPPQSLQSDEQKALFEYILRQQQQQQEQQQLAALVAAATASASVSHTPRGSLSTQNSSGSLVNQQQQQQPPPAPIQQQQHHHHSSSQRSSSGEAVYVSIPPSTSTTIPPAINSEPPSLPPQSLCSRQTSSERLLSSGQSIEDHISKLISENAAIVEPNPVLLKRRPYNRQNTSGSLTSGNDQTGSAQGSPGLRSPGISSQQQPPLTNIRIPTTRSQSMHEPAMLNTLKLACGSLTSGQPIIRSQINHICSRCNLKFPNEVGLNQHQDRCGGLGADALGVNKKDYLLKQHSTPQLNLNNPAPLTPQQIIQQQQKHLKDQAEHQARISALIGGGAGVAPDSFHHLTGRSSVPASNPSPPLTQQFGIVVSNGTTSTTGSGASSRKTSFQPVPLESRSHSKKRLLENVKPEDYIDVVGVSDSRPDSTSSNGIHAGSSSSAYMDTAPTKMARIQAPIPIRPTAIPAAIAFSQLQAPDCQPSTSAVIPQDLSLNKPHAFSHPNSLPNLRIIPPTTQSSCITGELSPESKSTREMVQLQLAFIERGTEPRPYVITIQDNDLPPIVDNDVNAAINRKMLKTITHYSRVCQTRPHFKIVGPQESQFALYSQNVASEEHVAQLFQYLACYSTKPKINEKDYCKYTIASGASIVAHPTHSSTVPAMIPQALLQSLQKPKVEVIVPKSEQPVPKHVQFTQHELEPIASSSKTITTKAETPIRYANNTDELIARKQSLPGAEYAAVAAKIKPISGGRSEEVEVYVRGRGRGRYVCDRCGIKCKKPSMLKKHLKSHTNIRPFNCFTCNFSFKTKGNLTKHLFSKTHRRKLEECKNFNDNNEPGSSSGLQIADDDDENDIMTSENREEIEKHIRMESIFVNDHNDADDEDEEDFSRVPEPGNNDITYRSFGQENIIYERDTHTPPTWWTLCKNGEEQETWEKPDLRRSCHSAPPMLEAEITQKLTAAASGVTVPVYNQALPQTEPNIGLIALQQIKRDGNVSKFAESVSRGDTEAQMQLTSEVIRMTKGADSMLPVVKTQEILKPLVRKRTYTGTVVNTAIDQQPVLSAFMSKDNFNCDQCSRKFRKESELNLHRQTHLIEKQQNAKSKSCQCPECKIQLRSRALLHKHMESAHGDIDMSYIDEPAPAIASSSTSSSSAAIGISNGTTMLNGVALSSVIGASLPCNATTLPMTRSLSISNGRSFICVDCSLGFRSHGVLAKHLRTKNHVRQLCSLGKLPEDVMTLIRDNSSALAGVDATDCDAARLSLIAIINRLRQSNGTPSTSDNTINLDTLTPPSKPSSLECNEQLSSVSPTPRIPDSNFRERGSSLSTIPRNKRNFDDISTSSSSTTATPRKQSKIVSSARSPTSSPTLIFGNGITTPIGISTTTTKSKQSHYQPDINNLHTYSISDVWIPPKAEDIDIGTRFINPGFQLIDSPTRNGFPSTSTNGFDEVTSDATSRSETSTPQQKSSFCLITNNNNNSNNAATTSTVLQPTILNSTKCQICELTFESPTELQIHFQSEHISIRDGSYFGCPHSNCEKVYPSKESLKKHLAMHYRPGSFIAPPPSMNNDQDEFAPPTNSSAMSPSDLLSNGGAASPAGMNRKSSKTAHTAPKRSPGAPEETHTISGIGVKPESNGSIIGIKNERLSLKCNQCNLEFNDANDLQTHYVTHFNRPHVCSVCDAGFTTIEALRSHSMAHLGIAQAQA